MNDSEENNLFQESIEKVRKMGNCELYPRQDVEDKTLEDVFFNKAKQRKRNFRWHRQGRR